MDLIERQDAIDALMEYSEMNAVEIIKGVRCLKLNGRYINADELIKRLKQANMDDAVAIALKMAGHERLWRKNRWKTTSESTSSEKPATHLET